MAKSYGEDAIGIVKQNPYNCRVGDKVLQTGNDCNKDVFDGDLSIVAKMDRDGPEVSIDYDGRTR